MKIHNTKPNAAELNSGIVFEPHPDGGMISVESVDAETAKRFASIPGYKIVEETNSKAAEAAERRRKEAAETAKKAAEEEERKAEEEAAKKEDAGKGSDKAPPAAKDTQNDSKKGK